MYMDIIFGYLQSGVSAVLPFIILLGLLIFVHELGHFLVAIWCGVRVETFSLGFGKKLLKYKRGDTTYCISLIPLGGYVKMFGDEVGANLPESERQFSFTHKPVWKRIAIVIAGPLMNFIFAVFIFSIIAAIGEEARAPQIGDVAEGTPAFEAGFRSGDRVLNAKSMSVKSWEQFQHVLNQGETLAIEVQRRFSEEKATVTVSPKLKPNPNLLSLDSMVGEIEGMSPHSRAAIVGVRHNSLAQTVGIKTGDRIVSINEENISFFRDIEKVLLKFKNSEVKIKIERLNDKDVPEPLDLNVNVGSVNSIQDFGFDNSDLYLAKIIEKSPAEIAGLKAGDRVLSINNIPINVWEDVLQKVKSYDEKTPIAFSVMRDNKAIEFSISPQMTSHMTSQGSEEKRFTVGVVPWVINAPPEVVKNVYAGLFAPIYRGYERTVDVTVMTCLSFLRLIQNKISPKNVSGVISIGVAAAETYKTGITYFLQMMAVISVNLFVLNLLPIPVLDGGHLLFYTIEAIRGAPVSMRKMEIAQQAGLFVLMSLMVFALFNDFSRVFGLW
jgi:regulator of sigma E protease